MPLTHPQPRRRSTIARRSGLVLGALFLAGLLPVAPVGAASPRGGAGLQPTIHYEEALAHAKDKIAFTPGGRVTVPFRPRATDHWKVGGRAPRTLPAGRVTGRAMRTLEEAAGTGAVTPADGPAALDQPIGDPAAKVAAVDASWDASANGPDIDLTAAVDPGGLRREVFGFLPYWELSDSSTRLDWEKISTVAFFGVGAAADGSLQKHNKDGSTTVGWSGWTSSRMTSVINAAHSSGARVVLTVQSFAWSTSGATRQKALLGSAAARANLAAQIAKAVRDRGADGVNLDFEPLASGYADEFTALVRKVRSALDATAKGYQLTFDTTGWIGNYPIEDATAAGGADAIMIMGYDYRSSGASVAGSIAPLRASIYDINDTLAAYLARVPASKLILGVPYYGRAWSTKTDNLHSENISGTKFGASSTAVYTTARQLLADHGRRYDATEGVAWTAYKRETCTATYGCVTSWRQLYVDDVTALKSKYDLVNKHGLRGVGIWALGYDGTRTELYTALKDKFITDAVPPAISGSSLSTDIISPNGDDQFETTTAKLTASAFIKWGYRIQPITGTTLGASVRSAHGQGQEADVHLGRRRPRGDASARREVQAHPVGGRRVGQPVREVLDRHGGHEATDRHHQGRGSELLARRQRLRRPPVARAGRRPRRSTGPSGSSMPAGRRGGSGSTTTAARGRPSGMGPATTARGCPTGSTRIASTDATGRATCASSTPPCCSTTRSSWPSGRTRASTHATVRRRG